MTAGENHHRDLADTISRLFWDNFLKSEPALVMRDVIAIELDKARDAERERCAKIAENKYSDTGYHPYYRQAAGVIADAIRNED